MAGMENAEANANMAVPGISPWNLALRDFFVFASSITAGFAVRALWMNGLKVYPIVLPGVFAGLIYSFLMFRRRSQS